MHLPRQTNMDITLPLAGSGQDGPGDLVGDAPVLEFPDVCAQGGPLLLSVVEIAVVAGDPLLGGVDGEPGICLLLGGGRR